MITIKEQDLVSIREFALKRYHQNSNFPSDNKNLQLFLLLSGFEAFLQSKGVKLEWDLDQNVTGSTHEEPLD